MNETETTTEQQNVMIPGFAYDPATGVVEYNGSKCPFKTFQPNDPNAPGPMVLTDSGPRPVMDLIHEQKYGAKLKAGTHVNKVGEIRPAAEFHKRYQDTPIRGRRPSEIGLADVRNYRRSFYAGKLTVREIAQTIDWSEGAVRNLLNGVTYWYA